MPNPFTNDPDDWRNAPTRSELQRRAIERLTDEAVRRVMGRMTPEAFRALRAVGRMRNQSPEEALREEIRLYIEEKIPLPDTESLISAMRDRFYQAGYAIGTLKRWIQNR